MRRRLFIRFPLPHVYVGTEGTAEIQIQFTQSRKAGSPFQRRERVIPGPEMIGAGVSDFRCEITFHMNMRDICRGRISPRKSFATNLDFYLYEAGFFDGDFETKR